MTSIGVLQIAIFLGLILVCTKPLGAFMAKLFEGQRTFLHPVLRWLEVLTYKLIGVKEDVEQRWTQYTAALLSFSVFGFLLTYLLQRAQGFLPLNPQNFNAGNVPPDLAFNTATSFVTNTNWQAYSGEATMSYFVQMAALAVQNFASAAAGMAIAVALIRGFARQEKRTIGELLGRRHTRYRLRALADLYHCRPAVRFAGCRSEFQTVYGSDDCRRHQAGHRSRAGSFPRSH